jgi:hypothetical protein
MNNIYKIKNKNIYSTLSEYFTWIFLPIGYPKSVSNDYLEYQIWDTLQGFIGYVKNIILTLSYFKGMGFGDDNGNLNNAMHIAIIRDTTGVISGLFIGIPTFTIVFSRKNELKKWRIVSEIIRIIAGFIEIYASLYSRDLFIFLSCIIVILQTISGVMSNQTRSSLVTHFAKDNNISDCSAKEGNQDRGVKIFGIPLALLLLYYIENNIEYIWVLYIVLVITQLFCNIMAMKVLKIE